MKILQVASNDFNFKKFITPLVEELEKQGYEVEAACNCAQYSQELKEKGFIMHHIPFSRNLNILSHITNLWKLVRLIKKQRYDCIHAHNPITSIIARIAAKITATPLTIYTVHGFYFHENMNPIFYRIAYYIEKFFCKYFTDYIFFVSKEDYELALKDKFNNKTKLVYIGNGVSSDRFNPLLYDENRIREEFGYNGDDIILMFVGRQVKEKGIWELVNAFKVLSEQYSNLKLIIVGGKVEGDRSSINVNELTKNYPEDIRKNILTLGLRDDIPRLLAMADIFILPSYREGLPVSIIEAMAMGKPIVATDIRGCREEVIPGVNGFLCKVKDHIDLAEKIKILINDKSIRQAFGSNSRQMFLETFDEKIVLNKQVEIYKSAINKDSN